MAENILDRFKESTEETAVEETIVTEEAKEASNEEISE